MTTPVRILILVLVSLFATSALTQTQRYEFKHSFRAPFYLGRGGTLPFWEFGGSAIVSEDRIRLTPAIQSRVGWVWNSVAADMDAWEVQLDFEIGGGGSRGADGMALWYVAEPKQEGTSMGSKDEFNGMAVFFDTFDNDGQNDEPRISLWVNDGTQRYNPFDDGKHGERGSCSNLNREARSKMRVIYRDGIIQVETDNDGHWVPCITAHHTLPRGFYFGLSAATGHLTDNHDVYSFITYNLDPWRRRPPVPAQESPEVQRHEEQQQQQEQQQEQQQQHHEEQQQQQHHEEQNQTPEPVKPNPYLPKDAPNPYLPRKQVQQQEEHHQQQQQQQSEQAHNGGEQTEQQQQQHNYQEQQQQHQEQQPRYQQEEMDKLAAKLDQLTFKVEAVRNQQDSLAHSLSQVLDKANGLQQQLQQSQPQQNQDRQAEVAAEVSGEVRAAMQEIRSVQNAVEDVRRLVQDDINQMGKTVTDLKNHISSEQGNTYNNVARLVRELQQHVSSLQVLVERGDRDQNSALQELKSGKEELKTVVEKSGSVAWWIYFCFFQACFGVAYVIWRKTRDDANKKFL